jgi:hypothetical protein
MSLCALGKDLLEVKFRAARRLARNEGGVLKQIKVPAFGISLRRTYCIRH